jgi:hypothetical protein
MTPPCAVPRRGSLAARLVPLGCLAVALGGCYTFAAASPAAVRPGARVRVALTPDGTNALDPVVGSSVSGLEGDVVRGNADTLVVRADKLLTTAGVDVAWTGRDLAIPVAWQRGVDQRRLAPGRTALLGAGGVALSAAVVVLVRRLGDSDGGPGGGDPIQVYRGHP